MGKIPHKKIRLRRGLAAFALAAAVSPVLFISGSSAAVAPVGEGFTVSAADLSYILKQIKIAEHHVANTTRLTGPCGALLGNGPFQIQSPLLVRGAADRRRIVQQPSAGSAAIRRGRRGLPAPDHPGLPRRAGRAARLRSLFPAVQADGDPTSYAQTRGNVFDSEPRTISNLIVDQTSTNPAAVRAAGFPVRTQGNDGVVPCETVPGSDPIVDIVPADARGLHAEGPDALHPERDDRRRPLAAVQLAVHDFGQFFDHGLDKITNGGSGTVFVPLKSDDPLFNPAPGAPNFMTVTRSTNRPGPDGISGDNPATAIDESADDIHEAVNTDSPWVDQSQTYTSHASHQVFLREYVDNSAGKPVATGKLLPTPLRPSTNPPEPRTAAWPHGAWSRTRRRPCSACTSSTPTSATSR